MPDDKQQKRAYDWEDGWLHWNKATLTPHQVRGVVQRACSKYRIPVPVCRFHTADHVKGKLHPTQYDPNEHYIEFRPRHHNEAIALHESAHAIVDTLLGPYREAHGPYWLGVYLWLLQDHGLAPKDALLASAKNARLTWAPLGKIAPNKIRTSYKKMIREKREHDQSE